MRGLLFAWKLPETTPPLWKKLWIAIAHVLRKAAESRVSFVAPTLLELDYPLKMGCLAFK